MKRNNVYSLLKSLVYIHLGHYLMKRNSFCTFVNQPLQEYISIKLSYQCQISVKPLSMEVICSNLQCNKEEVDNTL